MAELATIARPYAEALFKACAEQQVDLSEATAWVDELAAIATNPQLREVVDSPKVTAEQVLGVIVGVARSSVLHAVHCPRSHPIFCVPWLKTADCAFCPRLRHSFAPW